MSPAAKRALFQTPMSSKRRRTMSRPKVALSQLPASVKPEIKFNEPNTSGATSSSAIYYVRPTAQGDDGDDFTGSDCFLKSLDFGVLMSTTGWHACRVSVLVPKDPTTLPTYLNPLRRYNHHDFTVLYDEYFTETEKNGTRIKKTLDLKQKYNNFGTALLQNNVIVMVNVANTATISGCCRTYFTDP